MPLPVLSGSQCQPAVGTCLEGLLCDWIEGNLSVYCFHCDKTARPLNVTPWQPPDPALKLDSCTLRKCHQVTSLQCVVSCCMLSMNQEHNVCNQLETQFFTQGSHSISWESRPTWWKMKPFGLCETQCLLGWHVPNFDPELQPDAELETLGWHLWFFVHYSVLDLLVSTLYEQENVPARSKINCLLVMSIGWLAEMFVCIS